jgi:hypothetical protein
VPRIVIALLLVVLGGRAWGQGSGTEDEAFRVRSNGRLTLDGGLLLAAPTALATGFSTGVGAGASFGRVLVWGVRASWSSATESSIDWTVTHADMKLRAIAAVQRAAGRGRFALRLGLGPTLVHESRIRNQGMRAGLSGADLETSHFDTLPSADVEGVVAVHIAGPWLLVMSGGPSLSIVDGGVRGGWTALLGTGWQP